MKKRVLVTGDVALDVNIYPVRRECPRTPRSHGTRIEKTPGGAFLLHELIATASTSGRGVGQGSLFETVLGLPEDLDAALPEALCGYWLWEEKEGLATRGAHVWRLEQPLGYGGAHHAPGIFVDSKLESPEEVDIVVLDDGNLGFRLLTASGVWPAPLLDPDAKNPDWVVLKMSDPLCEGDLWRACRIHHADRTIALVDIEDIRRDEVRVTKGVSWERTALDLAGELERNPALSPLRDLRHLVVRIGFEGALVVTRRPDRDASFTLIFDAGSMEDDWSDRIEGRAMGFMSTLTAAVASRLATSDGRNVVIEGVKSGLAGMRAVLEGGHGDVDGDDGPGFPFEEIAAAILDDGARAGFADAPVPVPSAATDADWSILAGTAGTAFGARPLYGPAHHLARKGPGVMGRIPYQRFGKLLTMDRAEIESLRNLRQLIRDYVKNDKGKKPLSLAVFGPPGSGKSFGIKQIAEGILGKKVPLPEFNLSQFNEPADLIGALHQVRDLVLKGTTPVVFWDEFDSKGYDWLQYLLAPMQDGAFLEGQVTHPIGKCIFVFAGATSWDYENFGSNPKDAEGWKDFKLLKGPDFMSRLSGYLNVLGPNPRCAWDAAAEEWVPQDDDICFPVRRAILLRAMLGLKDDAPLEIDPGLLSAFLEIPKFEHGARSLEKILEQVKQRGLPGALRRSDLPPATVLALHADYEKFMEIAERDMGFIALAEDIAPAVHGFYVEELRSSGSRILLAEEFEKLPPDKQADNIAAARRIPMILGLVGLYLVPEAEARSEPEGLVEEILEQNIEILSAAEHDGWMDYRLRNGWELHEVREDALRRHHLLVPYEDLSDAEQEKDRSAVRSYPAKAALAGYRIVADVPLK